MKRILSKYGAYTSHIASFLTDPSVKPADRAKLPGYYQKWTNAKYFLGCAFHVDLLVPCTVPSKVMQFNDLDILSTLTSLLKSVKELEKLSSTHWINGQHMLPHYQNAQKMKVLYVINCKVKVI